MPGRGPHCSSFLNLERQSPRLGLGQVHGDTLWMFRSSWLRAARVPDKILSALGRSALGAENTGKSRQDIILGWLSPKVSASD